MKLVLLLRCLRWRKRGMWMTNRWWTTLISNLWAEKSRAKSRPRSQRSPRSTYVCHHCGLQGHTRPNCQKLREMNNASAPRSRGPKNDRRNWAGEPLRGWSSDIGVMDVMKMIGAFTNCLERFTRRFESPNSRTQSYKDITPNVSDVWVKKGTHA